MLPDFLDERLDLGFNWGTQGGPTFDSTIIDFGTANDAVNANREVERGEWELGERALSRRCDGDKIAYLLDFYRRVRGPLIPFRWQAREDYQAIKEPLGIGTGVETAFNLVKVAGAPDPEPYLRRIFKPVAGTVTVFLDDVEQAAGWTVDTTTGIITFASAPTGILTASFEFDVPVHFIADQLSLEYQAEDDTGDQIFFLASLPIREKLHIV